MGINGSAEHNGQSIHNVTSRNGLRDGGRGQLAHGFVHIFKMALAADFVSECLHSPS